MANCPNCGAPLTGHKCEYCGAVIFDFAALEIGKPVWINFKMGEQWMMAHVLPESASVHVEPMDEFVLYADGITQATFRRPAPVRIELSFIEIPTDKGYGHIVSERGVVPSTDLEVNL